MPQSIINNCQQKMEKTVESLKKELQTVKTGRANPQVLNKVEVVYYGSPMPLNQIATISAPEAQVLMIKPFDKNILKDIEKAILASNLGYNPGNDGETIRIVIPELTEERRRELVKQVKALAEDSKVTVRNLRREALEDIKKCELPEDQAKGMENDVQDMVNDYNKKIEAKLKEKEQELLTV